MYTHFYASTIRRPQAIVLYLDGRYKYLYQLGAFLLGVAPLGHA
jgi:hypothetical protein